MTKLGPVRRIVTGHAASGTAVVIMDQDDPHRIERRETGIVARPLWRTNCTPADISLTGDAISGAVPLPPPDRGTVFRIVDFPPAPPAEELDPGVLQSMAGGDHEGPPPRHPFMHRTKSVDYAIVLAGEIDMLLDDSEVRCRTGDVVIQQGTNHAWVNRGTDTCRIAFVLIDAK